MKLQVLETPTALLKVKEAAELLNISPWTLRRWTFEKKISAVRLGSAVRFELAELQRFIAACRSKPRGEGTDPQ